MTEEKKRKTLTQAQQLFLHEIEVQLERFKTLRWLNAVPTKLIVEDEVVWAREIDTPDMTLTLSATRPMLDACTIFIRAVGKPGRRSFMQDEPAVGAPALESTLKRLVGFPPMTPSSRRPNQRLRRSRRSRR